MVWRFPTAQFPTDQSYVIKYSQGVEVPNDQAYVIKYSQGVEAPTDQVSTDQTYVTKYGQGVEVSNDKSYVIMYIGMVWRRLRIRFQLIRHMLQSIARM